MYGTARGIPTGKVLCWTPESNKQIFYPPLLCFEPVTLHLLSETYSQYVYNLNLTQGKHKNLLPTVSVNLHAFSLASRTN